MEFVVSVGEKYCSHKCKAYLTRIRFELWDVCKKTKSEKLLSKLYIYIGDNMIKLNKEQSFQHCLATHAGIFYCLK